MDSFWSNFCRSSFFLVAIGCRTYTVYVHPEPIDESVDADQDGFFDHEDCDAQNPLVHPDAEEVCDGIDNDCNSRIDMDDSNVNLDTLQGYYLDVDGDGYGNPYPWVVVCTPEVIFVDNGDDCNDQDDFIHPGE